MFILFLKTVIYRWKHLTVDMVKELYLAREALDGRGGDRRSEDYKSKLRNQSFDSYCKK